MEVAARNASTGFMPKSTSNSSSRAPSPWAKTPMSLPLAIVTPASRAILNVARARLRRAARGLCPGDSLRIGLMPQTRSVSGRGPPALGHQLEYFRIAAVSVLDGRNARKCSPAHAFLGGCMSRYGNPD